MAFGSALVPVDDMDAALAFLSEEMGMEPRFVDGRRYAAFPPGAIALALLGEEERIVPQTTLGMRVEDIEGVVTRWSGKGAEILLPIASGPHERRAVMRIPGGLLVTLSQKIA